jgi:thiol-disulfide isomerase/thioredoxin
VHVNVNIIQGCLSVHLSLTLVGAQQPLVYKACMYAHVRAVLSQVWQELATPTELTAFMTSSQPSPAWPALDSTALNPKLRLVEFYATWCPACKAAAPGMAEVAGGHGQSCADSVLAAATLPCSVLAPA